MPWLSKHILLDKLLPRHGRNSVQRYTSMMLLFASLLDSRKNETRLATPFQGSQLEQAMLLAMQMQCK
jgi:hypothetical protein